MSNPCEGAPQPCTLIVEPTPPAPVVQPLTPRLEVTITFLIYLIFFAWIGQRRGARRELVVFLIALGSWLLLQTSVGNVAVRLANIFGKFLAFVQAGGLSANQEAGFAAVTSAPDIITEANRQGYLFMLWAIMLVLTYIWVSNWPLWEDWIALGRGAAGWAILLGMANGLLFASIFLPRLVALVAPPDTDYARLAERANVLGVLGSGIGLLIGNLSALWVLVRPQASIVLLVLLTIFLALVASTLRSGTRANRPSR